MEEVIALRDWHQRITLECVLPYAGMIESFAIPDRERFYNLEAYINFSTVLNEEYCPGCMQQRNEYMVDHAGYVIAVWNGRKSGTGNTVKYAKKTQANLILLESRVVTLSFCVTG